MNKDGLILIDKPKEITSFVAVAVVRRALGVKHCGHTGTLDPMATGLLPILTGRATKLSSYLLEGDKSYRATLRFGENTDSLDITGNVTHSGGRKPTEEELRRVLPRFAGKQRQVPPMYSAIKKDGVAMYKLARQGQQIDLPAREIEIYRLELLEYKDGEAVLDVDCSKGTYIRSLCRDIAKALDTYGCMSALVRTATCGFSLEQATGLYEAEARLKSGDHSMLLSPQQALPLQQYTPPAFFARLLKNGCAVDVKKLKGCPHKGWVMDQEECMGIGEILEDNTFKIVTHL